MYMWCEGPSMNTRDLQSATYPSVKSSSLACSQQSCSVTYKVLGGWGAHSGGVELPIRVSHDMPAICVASVPAASQRRVCESC